MKGFKARFVKTIYHNFRYDQYMTKVYKYRGQLYSIDFDLNNSYRGIFQDVKGEHLSWQQKIDDKIDNPKKEKTIESAEKGFELFWNFCDE